MRRKLRLGLALGSGSARGWAHIGAIRALEERGIKPDIVCGTSVGALVGAAYAAGELDRLEKWVTGLAWTTVVRLMDLTWRGGLIRGTRLFTLFGTCSPTARSTTCRSPMARSPPSCIPGASCGCATASCSKRCALPARCPGLFTPVLRDGAVLVDGGLVNPVPVSMCRALGADLVVAVDLSWGKLGPYRRSKEREVAPREEPSWLGRLTPKWIHKDKGKGEDPSIVKPEDAADHPLDLQRLPDLARHRRDARRAQPPRGRAGRRADHAAAAGFRHHGLPPRGRGDRGRARGGDRMGPLLEQMLR